MLWKDQVKRLWRAPDKPLRVFPDYLSHLEAKGGYIAEAKYDGFRGVVLIDDQEVRAYSRHFERLPVSKPVLDQFRGLGFRSGTAIDIEWMERRSGDSEAIYLFDTLYLEWQWQGNRPLAERLSTFDGMQLPSPIFRPASVTSGFLDFFESQIGDPNASPTEGIVLKHLSSRLIGKPTGSADNPLWCKVKWRDGPDGRQVVYKKRNSNEIRKTMAR